jgi:hypothetical protein
MGVGKIYKEQIAEFMMGMICRSIGFGGMNRSGKARGYYDGPHDDVPEITEGDMCLISLLKACLFVCLCLAAEAGWAGVNAVWAVNDGEKVKRDDLVNSNKPVNSAWDGSRIHLLGARNEMVAFQLIVEADVQGIGSLSVSLPELVGPGGQGIHYSPPGADPTDYVGRDIQLFSENYMFVGAATTADWIIQPGSPSAPRNMTGWVPVQLVPENALIGRGGFPLPVAANQNQAFWIEIFTGRDLQPARYSGIVTVTADQKIMEIPVDLDLFDFALPDQNSLQAMIYYESSQPITYQGRNLDPQYHRFAHRHRIELVQAYDVDLAMAASERFLGGDFTAPAGYAGPGEGIGNHIIPASFYGPGTGYDVRSTAWAQSDRWISFLKDHFPSALTFLYMPDEPGPSEYSGIRAMANNIHSNPGPGKDLPIFVTSAYAGALDGAIDIWCSPTQSYNIELAGFERSRGEKFWIYNGMRPYSGAILIDSPATDPRATIWGCFKHDIDVYFYWHGVHWEHNSQKPTNRLQNVWANPITFDNRGQVGKPADYGAFANGDGVLMYPGEEILHPDQDRGIAGPCSTLQLGNLRRGLQDHQYLSLARSLGLNATVETVLKSVVPHMFSDASVTVGFAESGNIYEEARYQLGKAIERKLVRSQFIRGQTGRHASR